MSTATYLKLKNSLTEGPAYQSPPLKNNHFFAFLGPSTNSKRKRSFSKESSGLVGKSLFSTKGILMTKKKKKKVSRKPTKKKKAVAKKSLKKKTRPKAKPKAKKPAKKKAKVKARKAPAKKTKAKTKAPAIKAKTKSSPAKPKPVAPPAPAPIMERPRVENRPAAASFQQERIFSESFEPDSSETDLKWEEEITEEASEIEELAFDEDFGDEVP